MRDFSLSILLVLLVSPLLAQEQTAVELTGLVGQQYIEAREKVIADGGDATIGVDTPRRFVAARAIAIRRSLPNVHAVLLAAERAAPGIYTGRITAAQWWIGVIEHDVKSVDDRVFLIAEAYLYRPFSDWDQRHWRGAVRSLVGSCVDARGIEDSKKTLVLLAVIAAQDDPKYVDDIIGALCTGYFHFQTGIDLLKGVVFGLDTARLSSAMSQLTRYGSQKRRDQWDEKYLRQSLERRLEIIDAIAADAAVRNRADVLVQLADGIRTHGLPLLDFGQYFDRPVAERLNAAIGKSAKSFTNDLALQKAVAALTEAIASYPASKEHAFLPDSPEEKKQP